MKRAGLYAFLLLAIMAACRETAVNPPYVFEKTPLGEVPQPEHNRATVKGVELGRKMFFDPYLSKNGKVSCATCHHPERAFSDGVALTKNGISGVQLLRHSPVLFNLAWVPAYFWDGGAKNLESQVFGPLSHKDEMGNNLADLMAKMNQHPEYPALFKEVWGTDTINSQNFSRTLAQFQRTLVSFGSPYDRWKAGNYSLPDEALRGYQVYKAKCASCHREGLFTDNLYHNNGLDSAFTNTIDEMLYFGRFRISTDSADIGKFRTASLRNLGFSAPYMHDGRFASLDAVLDHYSTGVNNYATLDSVLKQQEKPGIKLSDEERTALKLFLHHLNDTAFVSKKY